MAEIIYLKPAHEVSPVLAGFLGAGVLVVSVTVAVFLWTCCQRRYRQLRGSIKLQSGPCDPAVDPPYKFIHMLKGISIYPETLSNKKIVRVGRRPGTSRKSGGSGVEWGRNGEQGRGGGGGGRVIVVDADPETGLLNGSTHLQMSHLLPPAGQPRVERALPIRSDYCCLESSSGGNSSSSSCDASKTNSPFTPCQGEGTTTPPTSLGTLSLAVDYNFPKKALVVTIIGAQGLPAVDEQAGSSDPYVKMTILPEKKHRVKTRVLRKTLEPVFDETFTFYGVAYSTLSDLTLHFLVLSFDRFARDDVIGEAAVPLAGVDPSTGRVHITQHISKRHIQVKEGRGKDRYSDSHREV